jgi:tetratricopeptide (TPR) repeat protein
MRIDPILVKAVRFARQKKYGLAINLLEEEVNRFRGSFRFNYILGLCCLYSRDFRGALEYFKLAREIRLKDPFVLLGLAALFLIRGDSDRAVSFYLEVQEIDEKNPIACKALRTIRKHGARDTLPEWLDSGQIYRLFPPFPRLPLRLRTVFLSAASLLLLGSLSLSFLVKQRIVSWPFARNSERVGLSLSDLAEDERNEPVQTGGSFRYILTRRQVLSLYEEGRSLFNERRDDAAKVAFNRILESNAVDTIKNKIRILCDYMDIPGFDTLKDRFSYAEVRNEPVLYRNCHVIWRGMATNLVVLNDSTAFDFLVGYDTRKTLEGLVPVTFNFAIPVNTEQPLEVLGRIIPVISERGQEIQIEGVALNQSGLLDAGRLRGGTQ